MEMMIPTEVQVAIWVLIAGAIAYLFLQISDNKNRINLAEQGQEHLRNDLKGALEELKKDLDSLSNRFDLFMADERSFFKKFLTKTNEKDG